MGEYDQGVAVSVSPATVTSVSHDNTCIMTPAFSTSDTVTVGHSPSTRTSVGQCPLVRDPYESVTCEVRTSHVESDCAGEGLFTVRNIKQGEIVAFYNGVG